MKKVLICCNNNYFKKKIKKNNFFFINSKKKLKIKFLKKISPDLIFFPHWNHKISKSIFNNFICIGFHSTPLPYGRGGSPVQNMILRGYKTTKVCAYKINSQMDGGPIYIQQQISLKGSGEDIFLRIYKKILGIIFRLIIKLPNPKKQVGKATYFKRRKPSEGNLLNLKDINKIYDSIRMLDINFINYPKAFIENKKIKFNFKEAKLKKNKIEAKVEILRK